MDELADPMHQAAPPYYPESMRETQFKSFSYNPTEQPVPPPSGVVTQQPPSTMPSY